MSVGQWGGGAVGRWGRVAFIGALFSAPLPHCPTALAQTTDSLLAAANRAAGHWRSHDFAALLAGSREVELHLPGTDPSTPIRPAQAVELLRAFVGPAQELEVEVEVARNVEPNRAYVELRRTFMMRPGAERRAQVVYLTLRRDGGGYRVAEIRVVP